MERKIIKASDGMVLTNGNIYGRTIYLAEGLNESDFYEITEDEFKKHKPKKQKFLWKNKLKKGVEKCD